MDIRKIHEKIVKALIEHKENSILIYPKEKIDKMIYDAFHLSNIDDVRYFEEHFKDFKEAFFTFNTNRLYKEGKGFFDDKNLLFFLSAPKIITKEEVLQVYIDVLDNIKEKFSYYEVPIKEIQVKDKKVLEKFVSKVKEKVDKEDIDKIFFLTEFPADFVADKILSSKTDESKFFLKEMMSAISYENALADYMRKTAVELHKRGFDFRELILDSKDIHFALVGVLETIGKGFEKTFLNILKDFEDIEKDKTLSFLFEKTKDKKADFSNYFKKEILKVVEDRLTEDKKAKKFYTAYYNDIVENLIENPNFDLGKIMEVINKNKEILKRHYKSDLENFDKVLKNSVEKRKENIKKISSENKQKQNNVKKEFIKSR